MPAKAKTGVLFVLLLRQEECVKRYRARGLEPKAKHLAYPVGHGFIVLLNQTRGAEHKTAGRCMLSTRRIYHALHSGRYFVYPRVKR